MDCRTAQILLPFRDRPDELADDERAELEQHLAGCKNCAALARAERSFDDSVGRAMQNVVVPAGLREQIVGRLAIERGNDKSENTLRPSRKLVVAQRHKGVHQVYSPSGAMTRGELEVVSEHLDVLAVHELLPGKEVKAGDTWKLGGGVTR